MPAEQVRYVPAPNAFDRFRCLAFHTGRRTADADTGLFYSVNLREDSRAFLPPRQPGALFANQDI